MRLANAVMDLFKWGSIVACSLVAACGSRTPETSQPMANSVEAPMPAATTAEIVHALITVPAGASAPADYDDRLGALRQAPGVVNVLALHAQAGAEPSGFQSLAIVDFKDEASLNAWLSGEGAGTASTLHVRRADVLAHDASDGASGAASSSFYVINHYEALVSPADYKVYTEKYVVPNMAHQKSTGAMLAYTMYIEREPEGMKPKAVLVKQYVSPEEHVRAEAAKDDYKRDVLLKHPEWKQINDTKGSVRNDLTETSARPVI
jgi:hypothetical protein